MIIDDIKPEDISLDYSIELLGLISTMLSSDRDVRPTATQVKEQLTAIAIKLFQPNTAKCRMCAETFSSRNQLIKHLKKTGHNRKATVAEPESSARLPDNESGLTIRGCADAPAQYHYDERDLDVIDPSPCVVCNRYFNTKRQFFAHLGGVHHYRSTKFVQKRKAENDPNIEKREERLAKWTRKDMMRHDD
jgi:hypothetical protein